MLVDIKDAETKKTSELLAEILTQLNADNRVRFFTTRGKGAATVQCLRVMLSRVRTRLEAKGRPRKHFKLHSDIFPWTEHDGGRFDCIMLYRSKNQNHEVLETLEDLMANVQSA